MLRNPHVLHLRALLHKQTEVSLWEKARFCLCAVQRRLVYVATVVVSAILILLEVEHTVFVCTLL